MPVLRWIGRVVLLALVLLAARELYDALGVVGGLYAVACVAVVIAWRAAERRYELPTAVRWFIRGCIAVFCALLLVAALGVILTVLASATGGG